MVDSNLIEFKFQGGDADNNQLNLYDGSRFLYGAARFVHQIDYYRNTGKVTERINKQYSNFVINTPQQGSFLIQMLELGAPILMEQAIRVPIEVMFSYIWNIIVPSRIPDNKLQLEQEKTNQMMISAVADSNQNLAKSHQDYVELAMKLLKEKNKHLSLLESNRLELCEPYQNELRKLNPSDISLLTEKVRPAIVDMGKPTIKSADRLLINDGKNQLAYIDKYTVESLKGNEIDSLPISLSGKVIQYNRETGWGKFRAEKKYSYVIPSSKRVDWNQAVIKAMTFEKEKYFLFYPVRDSKKNIKHLIFDGILDIDDLLG